MQEKKLNVAKKANEIILKFREDQYFNDIMILSINRESTWHQEYALFYITFYFPTYDFEPSSEYEEVTFNYDKFYDDFESYLKSEFPNCYININKRLGEYEIIGPNNSEFVKNNFEDLEDIACNHNGYYLYDN